VGWSGAEWSVWVLCFFFFFFFFFFLMYFDSYIWDLVFGSVGVELVGSSTVV
jgi:hypothetical protein